jgi:predicted Rossmann fold flavoprotein
MRRVAVIGAGAAGTMAAIFAATSAAPDTEVLLLERTRDGGRKILISGGGRCNILPSDVDESRFVTDSPRPLLRRMIRSWPLREQIAFFENEIGLALTEEPGTGKLFPSSGRARDVRDRLLAYARGRGVVLVPDCFVTNLEPSGQGWTVARNGEPLYADAVIVATGGLSVPATGSDGSGLAVAESLGYSIRPPYAALTPLLAAPAPFASLSGVSLPVRLTAHASGVEAAAEGGFLFTHGGYSGPAVLDVSHVAVLSRIEHHAPARLTVRWTPLADAEWEQALKAHARRTVLAVLDEQLPHRFAELLLRSVDIRADLPLSQLDRDTRRRLIDALVRGVLPWNGDEGYKKAEVTGGGILLTDVDPKTMAGRKHRGVFFCGEMLDAFGPIGGYNFLWAWATGRAAGLGVSKMLC